MKTLISLFAAATLFISGSVFAHGDGHGHGKIISVQKAKTVAYMVAKKMSFKDTGLKIGKLDKSWGSVDKNSFKLTEKTEQGYIVSATNQTTKETLVFTISNSGALVDVQNKINFEAKHGHSH
ncbi:DUF6488 family protein [Parashewanella tropica]|uniref:DUF6488 family protein n=1 Tax=Parashewanella tropica TaxID=2547970 RepID=UPI00105A0435|nr:DUF6488 family protein [Parashewanella tropica]